MGVVKEAYNLICQQNKHIPVFLNAWWLDAVCGEDNWDYVSFEEAGQIKAIWPFCITNGKYGQIYIKLPKLTPFLGPWLIYPDDQKYCSQLSYEKELLFKLIDKLPKSDYFSQSINHSNLNLLPYYWKGFEQSLSFTYRLIDLKNIESVFLNFRENTRREIRKAQKILKVIESENIEIFFKVNTLTFDRQNKKIPYSYNFVENLDKACKNHECRSILMAIDRNNNIHATIYLIWDLNCTYYLMGGSNLNYRNSGALSLLLWEGIKQAAQRNQCFDFEGSMIEPIETFFRGFGASQLHYLKIFKYSRKGRSIKLLSDIKKLILNSP